LEDLNLIFLSLLSIFLRRSAFYCASNLACSSGSILTTAETYEGPRAGLPPPRTSIYCIAMLKLWYLFFVIK
jgi:hypothetical protein